MTAASCRRSILVAFLTVMMTLQRLATVSAWVPGAAWLSRSRAISGLLLKRQQPSRLMRMTSLGSSNNDEKDDDNDNNKNNEPLFYDDFLDMMGGDGNTGSDGTASASFFANDAQREASLRDTPEPDTGLVQQLLLQQRMQQVAAQEELERQAILDNWQQGRWSVRGVSLGSSASSSLDSSNIDSVLDEHDEDARRRSLGAPDHPFVLDPPDTTPLLDDDNDNDATNKDILSGDVHISTCLVQAGGDDDDDDDDDDEEAILWLGRTDGSLVAVRYSDSESWARFTTQLVSSSSPDGLSFTAQPALVREQSTRPQAVVSDEDPDVTTEVMEAQDTSVADPFDVVAQALQAPQSQKAPVQHILPMPGLVLSCVQGGSDIQTWTYPTAKSRSTDTSSLSSSPSFLVPQKLWSGVHSKPLVSLDAVPAVEEEESNNSLVCSVSQEGRVVLWDATSGELKARLLIFELGQGEAVSAVHTTDEQLFVGTTNGKVLIYTWSRVLEQVGSGGLDEDGIMMEPSGSLTASNDEISVMALTSVKTINEKLRGQETIYLAAGDERGTVKQWQLFARGEDRVESWPKLATQRLQGKAHLFQHYDLGLEPETTSNNNNIRKNAHEIVDLQFVNQGEMLLTASTDTIRCWNTSTGKESHTLSGFESLSSVGVLPAPRSAFCTNGMKNVVCIHDYQTGDDDDFDEDDFDSSEYLEFDQ